MARPEVMPGEPYARASCPFHHEKNQTPSLLIYRDRAWCLSERRHYSLKQVYEAFLAGLGTPYRHNPYEPLADEIVSIVPTSQAGAELRRRGIRPVPKIRQSADGCQIVFVNDDGHPQVYRSAQGYRTVGRDIVWSSVPRLPASSTLIAYGMLDAALLQQLAVDAGMDLWVVAPTWGQQSKRALVENLPGRIWVFPDIGEEATATRLLSSIGWRAAGMITTQGLGGKDACEVWEGRKHQEELINRLKKCI